MNSFNYVSICSGVGSCKIAAPQNWNCLYFSEIDRFASEVLAQRFPTIENIGDFTKSRRNNETVDLVIGGTPCQSFSIAGSKQGIRDERGNLTFQFIEYAKRIGSKWILWENVPNARSTNESNDFKFILSKFIQCGYFVTWRILDSKHFGSAQSRKRLFVVGYSGEQLGKLRSIFFERNCGKRDFAESREQEEKDRSRNTRYIGYDSRSNLVKRSFFGALTCKSWHLAHLLVDRKDQTIRRLTPLECERLQGLPDNHTFIDWNGKKAPDGLRYKAIGNGFQVDVVRYILRQIQKAEREVNE